VTVLLADLGGTRLKAGPSPSSVEVVVHGGDWLPALRALVARYAADEVALCVPGLVDEGRVVRLPGKLPGLVGADLAALLAVRVPLVVNDAIAYGVGEAGPGRTVVVTLGTGVGVAVVQDGVPLGRGPLGGGLLGGQLTLGGASGVDSSGRTGTFEAHCRAAALVAAVPGAASVADAYEALATAAPAAVQGFSTYRTWLVRGLTALALAHAPDVIVVGGGAAQPGLLDGVQEAVAAGLWPGQSVQVRPAALGDAAALVGLERMLRARVAA
jgi:glucokinase